MPGIKDFCVEDVQRPFVVARGQVRAAAYPHEPTASAHEVTYFFAAILIKMSSLSATAAAGVDHNVIIVERATTNVLCGNLLNAEPIGFLKYRQQFFVASPHALVVVYRHHDLFGPALGIGAGREQRRNRKEQKQRCGSESHGSLA